MNKIDKIEEKIIKIEIISWIVTFFVSILVAYINCCLIDKIYHPNIQKSLDLAKKILLSPEQAIPEPLEKIKFFASLIICSLTAYFIYLITHNVLTKKRKKIIDYLYSVSIILSSIFIIYLCYKSFSSLNPFHNQPQNSHDYIAKTNADFYFIGTFIYKYFFAYLFFIFPIIFFVVVYWKGNVKKIIFRINFKFFFLYCTLTLVALTFVISIFKFPYTFENRYDFNAVFYSTVQVFHGIPMLVNNFTNTYGLYPHFILPALKILGLSVLSFSFIMAILLCICFLIINYYLIRIIENKTIAFFGFTTVFYNSYLYFRTSTNFDAVFSTSPIRWLYPCLLLAYSLLYNSKTSFIFKNRFLSSTIPIFKNYRPTFLQLFSFVFFSLGILWSPDTGIFTFLSLILFYLYKEFDIENIYSSIFNIIITFLLAFLVVCFVFILYMFLIKNIYGSYPDILLMFSTIKVFSSLGFGMLPMPNAWHPWMIVLIVYFFGGLYSFSAKINNKISTKSENVFLLTILGLQFFLYYLGRSHNWNLFIINFPAFLLLTIFCDDLFKIAKEHKLVIFPFSIVFFSISFSVFQLINDKNKIIALISSKKDKKNNLIEQNKIINVSNIINDLTIDNEKVLILSSVQNQGLYHSLSKTKSTFNPGFIDLFTNKDFDSLKNKLINENNKIFYEPELFQFYNNEILTILSSMYNVNQEFNNGFLLWVMKKKMENTKSQFIIRPTKFDVVHELFDKDLNSYLSYSIGKIKREKIKEKFSLQIIFKPIKTKTIKLTEASTLVSNIKNNKGFILQQYEDDNKYIFAVKNKGIICPVVNGIWNYLCFEINVDKIKCYSNGNFIGTTIIDDSFEDSDFPLFVGNYNNLGGFFFGDIKELAIKNTLLDTINLSQNWKEICKLNL